MGIKAKLNLIDLEMALLAFQGVVNEYNRTHFRGHASRWKQKRNDLEKSFSNLDNIDYLLKTSPEVLEAIKAAAGNSKEIGSSLQRINESVEESMEAGMVTRESLLEIDSFINEVSSALLNIDANMSELSSGSREILQSTEELTVITHSISGGIGEIGDSVGAINDVSQLIGNLSDDLSREVMGFKT